MAFGSGRRGVEGLHKSGRSDPCWTTFQRIIVRQGDGGGGDVGPPWNSLSVKYASFLRPTDEPTVHISLILLIARYLRLHRWAWIPETQFAPHLAERIEPSEINLTLIN